MRLFEVLKKGEVLQEAKTWKRIQGWLNLVLIISPALVLVFPQIENLLSVSAISTLIGVAGGINVYLTTATTNKIGL